MKFHDQRRRIHVQVVKVGLTHAKLLAQIRNQQSETLQYELQVILACLRRCGRLVLSLDDLLSSNLSIGRGAIRCPIYALHYESA